MTDFHPALADAELVCAQSCALRAACGQPLVAPVPLPNATAGAVVSRFLVQK